MIWRTILAAAFLTVAGCSAYAEAPPETQPAALELTGRVVDEGEILSLHFEQQLEEKLAKLEEDTGVQLVVFTTSDLKGMKIETYSFELANAWGIGSAERHDGLMLLVAPNYRKLRIEVGYGLEASVKDEEATEIIEDDIVPWFEQEDYEKGVEAGVQRLVDEVTPFELKEAA